MNAPVEDSIARLKAEIIAQDWRISPKRAEMIAASLSCLQQHFQDRKKTHAMLSMAQSVLEHIRTRGGNPPETVDFLKEAMAHVVSQYEDLKYDPNREEEVFKSLFIHFNNLKEKIKAAPKKIKQDPTPAASIQTAQKPQNFKPSPRTTSEDHPFELQFYKNADTSAGSNYQGRDLTNIEADKLINDFKQSLITAGQVGSTIGDLLGALLANEAAKITKTKKEFPAEPEQKVQVAKAEEPEQFNNFQTAPQKQQYDRQESPIKKCPPTEVRVIMIGEQKLAIVENSIAATRPFKEKKMAGYVKDASVSLKDFGSFMQGLAKQFKGPLGKITNSRLKKISLPILAPQGFDLPETPDKSNTDLLIISNGNWHGAIACKVLKQQSQEMIKFYKKKNGDIAGTGYLEGDEEVLLLDSLPLLRREGFLVTPG